MGFFIMNDDYPAYAAAVVPRKGLTIVGTHIEVDVRRMSFPLLHSTPMAPEKFTMTFCKVKGKDNTIRIYGMWENVLAAWFTRWISYKVYAWAGTDVHSEADWQPDPPFNDSMLRSIGDCETGD